MSACGRTRLPTSTEPVPTDYGSRGGFCRLKRVRVARCHGDRPRGREAHGRQWRLRENGHIEGSRDQTNYLVGPYACSAALDMDTCVAADPHAELGWCLRQRNCPGCPGAVRGMLPLPDELQPRVESSDAAPILRHVRVEDRRYDKRLKRRMPGPS